MKTHSTIRFPAAMCIAFVLSASMSGQSSWQISGTGDWSNPANWSGAALPAAGADVAIGSSGTAVLSSGNASIGALNIATGGATGGLIINGSGTLTATKNATVGLNNNAQGSVFVNGSGYWQLTGNASNASIYLAGNADSTATGRMEIAGSGSVFARSVNLSYGNNSNASMLITDNGKLITIGGAHSFIGGNTGKTNAVGVVTISGSGYWDNASTTAAGAILLGNAGSGTLTLEGSGSLSSTNSAAGGTALSIGHSAGGKGALIVRDNSALTIGAGKFNVGGSGTGVLTMQDNASVTAPITTIATAGVGTLNLHGGMLTTGVVEHLSNNESALNFNSGTLRAMASSGTFITSAQNKLALNTTGAGAFIDSQEFAIATALSFAGDGGLTKLGTGELALAAVQAYTGVTTVTGGTLRLGANNAIATSSTVNVAAGAVVYSALDQTLGNLSGAGTVAGDTRVVLKNTADSTFAGDLSFGTLEKNGAGRLALAKAGSIGTGANITITQGALALTGGTLSASGTTTVASGATLGITSGAALLDTAALQLTSGAVIDVASYTIVNGGSASLATTTDAITSPLANVSLSLDGQLFTADVDKYYSVFLALGAGDKELLVKSGLFWNSTGLAHGTFNIAGGETFAPPVALGDRANGTFTALTGWDGKSLVKTGTGTLVFDTANTYTGTTSIASGTLRLAVADAIATSAAVNLAAGAVLDITTGAQTLNNLSGAGAITAAGSSLTLHSTDATTYTGAMSAGALEKTGAAMLILSGTGAFGTVAALDITQGGLAVTGGVLDVTGAMSLATSATLGIAGGSAKITTGAASFGSGAVINILSGADGTDLIESAAAITTYGNITFLNNGVPITSVTLDTYSAYTPALADSDKKIRLIASLVWNATGEAHGTFSIGSGVDFSPAAALNDRAAGSFTAYAGWDGKSITKTGVGTLNFTSANGYTGTTTVSEGTLQLTAANAIMSSTAVTIGANATLAATGTQTLNNLSGSGTASAGNSSLFILHSTLDSAFAGVLTGAGAVAKAGAGALTLSGSSDHTGGSTISAGKLISANAAALGTGTVTNNAALEFAITTDGVFAAPLAGAGTFAKTGAGVLTAIGSTFSIAVANITGGTLALGDATHTVSGSAGSLTVGSGAGLVMGADSTLAVGGTLALAANSSLGFILGSGTGPVINASGVDIGSGVSLNLSGISGSTEMPFQAIATTNGITNDFANITIGGAAAGGIADYITISPGKTADGKGYKIDAFLTWNQTGTVRHGTFTLTDAAESFTIGQELADKVANPDTGWDGKSLTKSGSGTLILAAANTHTGTTLVNEGTLRLDTANAIATSSVVNIAANATLAATGTQTLRNLTGSGTAVLSDNSSLFILHSTLDSAFAGVLTGEGAVEKTGAGTLTLSGANDYSGGTLITEGRLKATALSALGGGGMANNATLELALAGGDTLTQALSGSGALLKTGAGTLTLATSNTAFNGTALIDAGNLLLTNAAALGASDIVAAGGATVEYRGIVNATTQSAVMGDGTLVVTSSTLALAKGGAGIRDVQVNNSKLTLAHEKALGDGIAYMNVNAGSQLLFAANGIRLDTVALAPGSTLGFAPSTAASSLRTATISNLALTGSASLLMNVNLSLAQSGVNAGGLAGDYLRVTDSFSGVYSLTVNPGVFRPTTYGISLELINTPTPTAADAFALGGTSPQITIGLIAYELRQGNGTELLPNPNFWYLADTGVSPAADVIFSAAAMVGVDWHYSLDSLYLRMGDLRASLIGDDSDAAVQAGNWMRVRGYRLDARSSLTGAAFQQDVYGVTIGIDKIFTLENSRIVLGALADAGKLSRVFDNGASGDTRTISGGLYASWLHQAGWYADGVAKYDHNENAFNIRALVGQPDDTTYKNDVQGLSLELGRRVQGADGWWIELAAQGSVTWINGAGYDTHPNSLTLHVEVEDATAVQYRGQIRFGRQFFNTRFHPYAKAGMANGETCGGKINAGISRRKIDFDGWRAEAGAGFVWRVGDSNQVYFDYEYAHAGSYDRAWSFNVGFRHTW